MPYISLEPAQRIASYRKLAASSWRHPRDPTTYAALDIPVENAEAFLVKASGTNKPTLTHFVTMVMAHCLEQYPELNHVLRLGRLQRRSAVDAFITTMVRSADHRDLAGFVVRNVNVLGLDAFTAACDEGVQALRNDTDETARKARRFIECTPVWILRPVTRVMDFLQYDLNIPLEVFGLPRDPFGSFIVTNVGALGVESALVPLSPYSRCPLMVCIGKPREVPAVRDGQVVVERLVNIGVTFDHRHADGAHCGLMLRRFKKIFDRPEAFPKVFAPVDQ